MKNIQMFFRIIIITAIVLTLCSLTAFAEESTISSAASLDLADGSIVITQADGVTTFTQGETVIHTTAGSGIIRQSTVSTGNTISLESGDVTLTVSDLNVSASTSPISMAKSTQLKLILLNNNALYVSYDHDCIDVPASAELTIQGPGTITAIADADGSGIGSHIGSCGTINILSGTVTAKVDSSRSGGSGIGGNSAIISISGGTVTAIGGANAAGIKGDSIIISDGTIIAKGGDYSEFCAGLQGSSITINGGSIEATGRDYGGGISGNTITINGGEITAKGDYWGAGIGGINCTILISGGSVTATGGTRGAGIGGREGCAGGTITISGGTITATSSGGAGIGGGYKDHGGIITISGGTIVATSVTGAGIGGGSDGYGGGAVMGGTVSISHADVTAAGYDCAIGDCESITIDKSAVVNLSHSYSWGSDCQEQIKIKTHPVDSAALVGNRAKFTVDAYGYSGLSYQWQTWDEELWSWVDLEGQTSPIGMSLPLSTETDVSNYRCVVTNGWGNTAYSEDSASKAIILAFTRNRQI